MLDGEGRGRRRGPRGRRWPRGRPASRPGPAEGRGRCRRPDPVAEGGGGGRRALLPRGHSRRGEGPPRGWRRWRQSTSSPPPRPLQEATSAPAEPSGEHRGCPEVQVVVGGGDGGWDGGDEEKREDSRIGDAWGLASFCSICCGIHSGRAFFILRMGKGCNTPWHGDRNAYTHLLHLFNN